VRQVSPDIYGHACDECGLHRPPILTTETRDRLQREQTSALAESVNLFVIHSPSASAEQGQQSNRLRPLPSNGTVPLFPKKAEVCNQKAEVDEGAGEGAETLPTDFFYDLQCFC
jgi:hypothetical protein